MAEIRALPSYLFAISFRCQPSRCLGRHDGCHFCQHLSSEQAGFDCQAAALIVCETKPSSAKLMTKDSAFFLQILDSVLLLLIDPASDREQQKAERIQCFRYRFSSLTSPL